jgi:hypothetical protein
MIPENVQAAIAKASSTYSPDCSTIDMHVLDWQLIRSHIAAQDSEIDRINAECKQHLRKAMENGRDANIAEARARMGDALLLGWSTNCCPYRETMNYLESAT